MGFMSFDTLISRITTKEPGIKITQRNSPLHPIRVKFKGQQEDAGGKHGQTGFVHATRKPFNLTPMPCIPKVY